MEEMNALANVLVTENEEANQVTTSNFVNRLGASDKGPSPTLGKCTTPVGQLDH